MRRFLFFLGVLVFSWASLAQAKTYVVSVNQFVEHPALDAVLKGFQDYLKENKFQIKYYIHNAQGNMATANQIAQQIVGEHPDLILAIATPSAQACAQAIKKSPQLQDTPLLFTAITDPIGAGLVRDLKKPGKNITGVSDLLPIDQHLKMVKTFYPDLKALGIIYNPGEANSKTLVRLIRKQAAKMKIQLQEAIATKSSEVYQAAQSLVGRVDAIYIPTDNTVISSFESVVKVCEQNKIPLFAGDVDSVARGAVAALGFDYYQHGRQTGAMAKRIFLGEKPGDMPVETQKKLKLAINLKAAKAMHVTVPEKLLQQADKIYR